MSLVSDAVGARGEREIPSTSVTDLTRVQAALDPKHVDNLVPAIPRKVEFR